MKLTALSLVCLATAVGCAIDSRGHRTLDVDKTIRVLDTASDLLRSFRTPVTKVGVLGTPIGEQPTIVNFDPPRPGDPLIFTGAFPAALP